MKKLVSAVIVTRNRQKEALKAVASIYWQTYRPLQVILVDNGSVDQTASAVGKKYPKTKVVKSPINRGGAGGRNLGLLHTKGELVLFMDDDAVADRNMVLQLVKVMDADSKIGIAQPKIYDMERKDVIQGVGHGINLLTGRVFGIGVGEADRGQYDKIMDVPMVGCAWLVKKEVFKKIGRYDEDFFIPYEDSDFSLRASRAGFRVCLAPKALVWHSGHGNSALPKNLRMLGITVPERAYRLSRNKIIFMRKHAPFLNQLIFFLVFVPAYTVLHSAIILSSGRFDILRDYWYGLLSGFKYVLTK